MKSKRWFVVLMVSSLLLSKRATAQITSWEDLFIGKDTTAVLDSLMRDFDDYLDSINSRRSVFTAGLTTGTSLFSFESSNNAVYTTERKFLISPFAGYFHSSGFGVSGSAYTMIDRGSLVPFQFAISPSYDLLKKRFSTGISYTKFFVKDSLNFYTTPIQQEAFAYFSYKGWFVRPTVSVSYGWGSTTSFEKRRIKIQKNRKKNARRIDITEKREESLHDLSVVFSVKKDFSFHDVLRKRDMVSLTPVLLVNCGTQQYGFNSSYSYTSTAKVKSGNLPSNVSITDRSTFSPQSAAVIMRASYLCGRFLVQPQFVMDYFIPGTEQQLNAAFSVTAGVSF